MKPILLLSLLLLGFSCKRKVSPEDIQAELSKAMLNQLYLDHHSDTSKVKYEILSVSFFPEKTFYNCEYKVHMHIPMTGFDTVGFMSATISKDFKEVKRKF
jgi:hypothetical protein